MWISLSLPCFGFVELLGGVYSYLSSDLGSFGHYFFKYFFCPFLSSLSGIPIMYMLFCLMVSHRSLRLCSLFFIIFSSLFLSSDWLISYYLIFKFIDSSTCSDLLLNPSVFHFSYLLYFSDPEFLFHCPL